jgi:hypothetical protein
MSSPWTALLKFPSLDKLDPYATPRYGQTTACLYAYLYGHPGFVRLDFAKAGLPRKSASDLDALLFFSLAGLFDYLLICGTSALSTWLFWILGIALPQYTMRLLFPVNFLVRARLSGLMEHLIDSETSWPSTAGAILETCPSIYWHLVAKLANAVPVSWSYSLLLRLVLSFLTGGEAIYYDADLCLNCTWSEIAWNAAKSTVIEQAGRLVPLLAIFLLAIIAQISQIIQDRRIWNKVGEWIRDSLETLRSVDIGAGAVIAWLELPLKEVGQIVGNSLTNLIIFVIHLHVLPWMNGNPPVDRAESVVAAKAKLNYLVSIIWANRSIRLKRGDQTHSTFCCWPPTGVVSRKNILVLFAIARYRATRVLDGLSRRHGPTTKEPYQRLGAQQVRLLKLFPALLSSQELVCELSVHNLKTPGAYKAISYRWSDEWSGPDSKIGPVALVNGYSLVVGAGTYEALRGIRSRWATQSIWIDAICINQQDDAEKGGQVQMMADIYAGASKVVIWLGEPKNAGPAIRTLRGLWARLKLLDWVWTEQVYEARATSPSWLALKELVRREWFERSWIVQEVAVASSAEVRYGHSTVPWDIFASFAITVWSHPLKRYLSTDAPSGTMGNLVARSNFGIQWDFVGSLGMMIVPRALDPILKPVEFYVNWNGTEAPKIAKGAFGLRHTQILQQLRVMNRAGRRKQISFYLKNLNCGRGRFLSTELRDRVFSVLGMSLQGHLRDFKPNYQDPVADIYTGTARHCYAQGTSLLAESGSGYEYKINGSKPCLCRPGASECTCGSSIAVPSWVPNWAGIRVHGPLDTTDYEGETHGLQVLHDQAGYPANAGAPARTGMNALHYQAARQSRFCAAIAPDSGNLVLRGARRIDVLEHCAAMFAPRYVRRMAGVADELPPGGGGQKRPDQRWTRYAYDENMPLNGPGCWLAFAAAHTPEVYTHEGGRTTTRMKAFLTTILGDRFLAGGFSYEDIEVLFFEFADNLRRVQGGESIIEVFEVLVGSTRTHRHQAFHGALGNVCSGRRFGVTKAGIMGMFPMGAREGDDIWLIGGMRTPFVLRRCLGEGGKMAWENVGECYVYGVMQGEAWDPMRTTKIELR